MTRLSVNINKIATLRNARGGNVPNLVEFAKKIETYGAEGVTVHPRPDERHITYQDVRDLKPILTTEFNIEGNPKEQKFIDLVLENKPEQVTLVPDVQGQLTSNHGWDTVKHREFLTEILALFKAERIRTSVFVDAIPSMVEGAKACGSDRIELYTESYASLFHSDPSKAIAPFITAAHKANEIGIEINAGHDLDLNNLKFFKDSIPNLKEVSIGHALIADALHYGMENTVQLYLRALKH
ncbi:MAG: pyridoxine 5'-phosphate synthase [Flavobacteriales bacterium]|jgi:pyridoxine 5-phosphate synthase|nr:pyridoxine 5'-phosphate synthase [Flavobacteriales bacterium]